MIKILVKSTPTHFNALPDLAQCIHIVWSGEVSFEFILDTLMIMDLIFPFIICAFHAFNIQDTSNYILFTKNHLTSYVPTYHILKIYLLNLVAKCINANIKLL
jgi:hypothetical protein